MFNVCQRTLLAPVRVQRYCRHFLSKRRDGKANFDSLGAWGWDVTASPPLLEQVSLKRGKLIPHISTESVGRSSITGRRTTNEDRYAVKELQPNLLYLAVFDGHGGPQCAEYCQMHLVENIHNILARTSPDECTDLQTVLQEAFFVTESAFAHFVNCKKLSPEPAASGTTATVCLLRDGVELVVGHVGDSRALLCRDGSARRLTVDHTPKVAGERERIVKAGGIIVEREGSGHTMVNGRLAMTRSIGDLDLKPYGVISEPDTKRLEVKHHRDSFLLLTTDGINCVLRDQETCNLISSSAGGGVDAKRAAEMLTDEAVGLSSEDNSTALVLPLGAWGQYGETAPVFHSFGRTMALSSRFG